MTPTRKMWTFRTLNYTVEALIHPEVEDPLDVFDDEETVSSISNGSLTWFWVEVMVVKNGYEVGTDTLGCNVYKNPEDFFADHRDPNPMNRNCTLMRAAKGENVVICHYFPDMVRQAVMDARMTMANDLRDIGG